jgi:hypothetical protein
MVDANVVDANVFNHAVGSQFSTDAWGKFFEWAVNLFPNTFQLIQSSNRYLIAIGVLTFLVNYVIASKLPAEGIVSYVVSFVIVMALAPLWAPLVPVV